MVNDNSLEDEILALVGGKDLFGFPAASNEDNTTHATARAAETGNPPQPTREEKQSGTSRVSSSKRRNRDSEDEDATFNLSEDAKKAKRSRSTRSTNDSVDGYDAELMGDSADRKWLAQLSEVEREKIISERAEKRQLLLERREIQTRIGRPTGDADDGQRRSTRAGPSQKGKSDSLLELKRRREEKGARKAARAEDRSPRRRRRRGSHSSSDYDSSSSTGGKSRSSKDERRGETRERASKASQPVALAEINAIRLTREQLSKWVHAPYFEKAVTGCFVRLALGDVADKRVYRMAYVKDVTKYHRSYPLESTVTDKALVLKHGAAEKPFNMSTLSNSPFTQSEYDRYIVVTAKEDGLVPTSQHVAQKREDVQWALNYTLTDAEVAEMVKKRQALNRVPTNLGKEKVILLRKRDNAIANGDTEELERLNKQIAELEAMQKSMEDPNDKQLAWAAINQKNREKTLADVRAAEAEALLEKIRLRAEVLEQSRKAKSISDNSKSVSETRAAESSSPNEATQHQKPPAINKPGAPRLSRFEELIANCDVDLSDLI